MSGLGETSAYVDIMSDGRFKLPIVAFEPRLLAQVGYLLSKSRILSRGPFLLIYRPVDSYTLNNR